jgi:uncharacterized protein
MDRKVALITGATSGIGAAFARHFAKEGYDLIITGRRKELISARAADIIEKYKVNVEIILAEFANENDVAKIEETIKKNPNIEVLVNNAGFGLLRPFWRDEVKNQDNMVKVHIDAPVRFIHAVLPIMVKNKKGIIINMSSLASFMPIPRDSMYSATKLFHNSFMQSMHIGFRDKGIKVQVLCPGFVRTDFHEKMGLKNSELKNRGILRWMQPDQIVAISAKNLRKKNKVIVVPGFWNKLIRFIVISLPRPLYYNLANKFLQ